MASSRNRRVFLVLAGVAVVGLLVAAGNFAQTWVQACDARAQLRANAFYAVDLIKSGNAGGRKDILLGYVRQRIRMDNSEHRSQLFVSVCDAYDQRTPDPVPQDPFPHLAAVALP